MTLIIKITLGHRIMNDFVFTDFSVSCNEWMLLYHKEIKPLKS